MSSNELEITKEAVASAMRLGLADGDAKTTEARIRELVYLSAIVTHPLGNRRYDDWIFTVGGPQAQRVEHVHLIMCKVCEDSKRVTVMDECPYCEGGGCQRCRDGYVSSMIPCPNCSLKSKTVF